jgi:alginate O-acetyltransferase complex protein AlgI
VLFNSFAFPPFLGIVAVATFAVPRARRWLVLLTASLYFYAVFNVAYVGLLVGATLIAFVGGLAIGRVSAERQRIALLTVAVVAELGALFVFKYFDFFAGSVDTSLRATLLPHLGLLVPAGLSFFTFSCVSYLVDVFRRKLPAERHLGTFAVYVAFFPKLLAGPIERATHFLPQLKHGVLFDPDSVTVGLQLILWGLFKKVVIADRLAVFVNTAYQSPAFVSPVDLVLATYFFAFQIYCDFSGYSDIAIGAARVLGFGLIENFRRPYLATTIGEFWSQRWHISLTRWFRDYMYIPLGGSRGSRLRWMFNILAVFVVSGLWHGANWTFIVWGALNGLYQVAYLLTSSPRARLGAFLRLPRWLAGLLSGLLTFHLVLIAWVFFRAASLADASTVLARVAQAAPKLPDLVRAYPFTGGILLSIGLIVFLLLIEFVEERRPIWEALRARPVYQRWAVYYALLAALLLFGTWNLTQFVYMQF